MNRLFATVVLTLGLCSAANAYGTGVYLPVYSYAKSASALHVREFAPSPRPDNAAAPALKWDFPASYTGHRSVCWLPGATTNMAFIAWVGGDEWQPGDPFGFTPAASPSNTQAIALTRTSPTTPRIKLWTGESDRSLLRGETSPPAKYGNAAIVASDASNYVRFVPVAHDSLPHAVRVRIVRHKVDKSFNWKVATAAEVIFDKTFCSDVRDFIHEGDFLGDGKFDIDWDKLEGIYRNNLSVEMAGCEVTNMTYAVVVGDGDIEYYSDDDTYHSVKALPYVVTRRFEVEHTPPTIVSVDGGGVARSARPTFSWRIDGEDKWAAAFGTTYTAFRIKVWDSSNAEVCDSGLQRMPPIGAGRLYSWRPASDIVSDGSSYTWRVFTYNAKFRSDDGSAGYGDKGSATKAFSASFGGASPAPVGQGGIHLPVYSYARASSPLHVRSMVEDVFSDEREWTFPASYTGHRSVCWLPGATSNMAFIAWVGGDEWQPGDPFGFTPAASPSNVQAIALTRTSAVTPRLRLWTESTSDRALRYNETPPSNRCAIVDVASIPKATRVRVARYAINDKEVWDLSTLIKVFMDKTFENDVRDFIHEGDLLSCGEFDIDWDTLEADVVGNESVEDYCPNGVTNMLYAIIIGDGAADYANVAVYRRTKSHPYVVQRRFEVTHTTPTAVSCTTNAVGAVFTWRIDGEDKWASAFGTTYTAFRVRVYDSGSNVLHDTGYRRMPPADMDNTYRWTAPADWLADRASWSTWRVFTYNAKFKTDDVGSGSATFTP